MNYTTYLQEGLKIFILVFVLGNIIDQLFLSAQKKYNIPKSKLFGLFQLFSIITIAYVVHVLTPYKTSIELQVYTPAVLFSSLMLNIQKTMFYNLDLDLETHISGFLPI